MTVRIPIIGNLLVMLTGAAIVAAIIMSRPDSGSERTAAVTEPSAAEPAWTAPEASGTVENSV